MKPEKPNDRSSRDAALARLLAEALDSKKAGSTQGAACPDAEVLAAYAEHGLSDQEGSRCESHIADCSRCQKIIASVLVSGENLEDAELSEQGRLAPASMLRKPMGPSAAPGILRWPGFWRWWVPGLGLAVAVALWFVLHPALAPLPAPRAPATTGTPQGSALGNASTSVTKPEETEMAEAKVPPPPPAGVSGGTIRDSEGPQANSTADALKKSPKQGSLQNEAQAAPVLDADRATGVPKAPEKDAERPSVEAADQKKEKVEVSGEMPAISTAAPTASQLAPPAAPTPQQSAGVSAGASVSNQVRALAKTVSPPIVFGTPDRSVLWRVGPGGLIENSSNQGKSWQQQASGVTADLLAGAAPSTKIAWVAGRGGILLRTEDGEHWQRVMPPTFAPNVTPPDWIAVDARDELHATVASRDLHRYATADGGRTWVQQQ